MKMYIRTTLLVATHDEHTCKNDHATLQEVPNWATGESSGHFGNRSKNLSALRRCCCDYASHEREIQKNQKIQNCEEMGTKENFKILKDK